ncbi:FAD-dependent monooxygenase family protein [Halomicronema hongdechloris]|nr:flavin-dependent dehydrogenase [Halomicronema hongdechloris]
MQEVLYLEVPTPNTNAVKGWLQETFTPGHGQKIVTTDGIRIEPDPSTSSVATTGLPRALAIVTWSAQRTTYLKAFRWQTPLSRETALLEQLNRQIRQHFPLTPPQLPEIDLSQQTIFKALAPHYPKTVAYFQRMPNGEADLSQVYSREKRWRDCVSTLSQPAKVIFRQGDPAAPSRRLSASDEDSSPSDAPGPDDTEDHYDLIVIGGVLGVIQAAAMALLGHRVLVIERHAFGQLNREWNLSRSEGQTLIDLGLFSQEELAGLILQEYDGGHIKCLDVNIPPLTRAPVLQTTGVLNVALDTAALIRQCGAKLRAAGGTILDNTEFRWAEIDDDQATVYVQPKGSEAYQARRGRVLVDAMGINSPIAWQLNRERTVNSVCPMVGARISGGIPETVWDPHYSDLISSHGDISRGRQLLWELLPGSERELTIYLFHYHPVNPDNPGSLLALYEDFFHLLPDYRRCDPDKLTWRKPTFGYVPGYFSQSPKERAIAWDRIVAIGDTACLHSPLLLTGLSSLVRHLPRLSALLHTALSHDLVKARHLRQIRAFQSNTAVTWLLAKGMMVPPGRQLPPARVNAVLNGFFTSLAQEKPEVVERFLQDGWGWLEFNRVLLKAGYQNPSMLKWIWGLAKADLGRWVLAYLSFTLHAIVGVLFGWLPRWVAWSRAWWETLTPSGWFWLQAQSYKLTYGLGKPPPVETTLQLPPPPPLPKKQPPKPVPRDNATDTGAPNGVVPKR